MGSQVYTFFFALSIFAFAALTFSTEIEICLVMISSENPCLYNCRRTCLRCFIKSVQRSFSVNLNDFSMIFVPLSTFSLRVIISPLIMDILAGNELNVKDYLNIRFWLLFRSLRFGLCGD